MSGTSKLTRSGHVASLVLPPSRFALTVSLLRRGDVMLKFSLCILAGFVMWLITGAWVPPFGYRMGEIPARDIVARIAFEIPDPRATEQLRKQKRSEMACIYVHDDRPLRELRSALQDRIFRISAAKSYDQVDPSVWREFMPDATTQDADRTRRRPYSRNSARRCTTMPAWRSLIGPCSGHSSNSTRRAY